MGRDNNKATKLIISFLTSWQSRFCPSNPLGCRSYFAPERSFRPIPRQRKAVFGAVWRSDPSLCSRRRPTGSQDIQRPAGIRDLGSARNWRSRHNDDGTEKTKTKTNPCCCCCAGGFLLVLPTPRASSWQTPACTTDRPFQRPTRRRRARSLGNHKSHLVARLRLQFRHRVPFSKPKRGAATT